MRIVVALGDRAFLRHESPAGVLQRHHVEEAVARLVCLARENELIITHAHGPQLELAAVESVGEAELTLPFSLDVIAAQTQGMVGYWLTQALANELPGRKVAALITQTLVRRDDPAFANPTAFVGPAYGESEARRLAEEHHWSVARDGALWRRVVASPDPLAVLGLPAVEALAKCGTIVVCGGGGGIPVERSADGRLVGVEAVVDNYLATSVIARDLRADLLMMLSDVEGIVGDGTAAEGPIAKASASELRSMSFTATSTRPKVEAACRFVEATGCRAVIGKLDDALALLDGSSGTNVVH